VKWRPHRHCHGCAANLSCCRGTHDAGPGAGAAGGFFVPDFDTQFRDADGNVVGIF